MSNMIDVAHLYDDVILHRGGRAAKLRFDMKHGPGAADRVLQGSW